jgi:hypothetical protein
MKHVLSYFGNDFPSQVRVPHAVKYSKYAKEASETAVRAEKVAVGEPPYVARLHRMAAADHASAAQANGIAAERLHDIGEHDLAKKAEENEQAHLAAEKKHLRTAEQIGKKGGRFVFSATGLKHYIGKGG